MKKSEVPQDNEGLLEGKLREVCYAVDENGNYTTVLSTGWTPKNAALKQAWETVNDKVEDVRKKVMDGKLSPVAYFMEKNLMDIKTLSQYAGIPKWRVRRHLKPRVFRKLSHDNMQKYAEAFEININRLKDFNEPST